MQFAAPPGAGVRNSIFLNFPPVPCSTCEADVESLDFPEDHPIKEVHREIKNSWENKRKEHTKEFSVLDIVKLTTAYQHTILSLSNRNSTLGQIHWLFDCYNYEISTYCPDESGAILLSLTFTAIFDHFIMDNLPGLTVVQRGKHKYSANETYDVVEPLIKQTTLSNYHWIILKFYYFHAKFQWDGHTTEQVTKVMAYKSLNLAFERANETLRKKGEQLAKNSEGILKQFKREYKGEAPHWSGEVLRRMSSQLALWNQEVYHQLIDLKQWPQSFGVCPLLSELMMLENKPYNCLAFDIYQDS